MKSKNRMGTPTPSLAAEIHALKAAYVALNRNDIPAFVALFEPQIERIEPADFPGGGVYHGLAAVTAHVSLHRGHWAEGACEPERFVVTGDKIIVSVHVRVRLKHESEWREGLVADVFTFHHGKVVQWRTFADEQQARAWAGVTPADAGH